MANNYLPPNPGQPLDTGTGGFQPAGVSDKRHSFDTGAAEESPSEQPTWSPGQVAVDDTVRDVTPTTKKTLAAYLSAATLGLTPSTQNNRPNAYPIHQGSGPGDPGPVPLRLRDANNYVPPLVPTDANLSQPHFTDVIPGDAKTPAAGVLLSSVTVGRAAPPSSTAVPGDRLLADATVGGAPPAGPVAFTSLADGPVRTYTDEVLKTPVAGVLTVDTLHSPQNNVVNSPTPMPPTMTDAAYFLSETTKGATPSSYGFSPNEWPVESGPGQSPVFLKLHDTAGHTQPLTPVVNLAPQPHFVDVTPGDGRSPAAVGLDVTRGRAAPTSPTAVGGDRLLRDAVVPAPAAPSPPPPGTVNVTTLDPDSPVKAYTDGLVGPDLGDVLFDPASDLVRQSVPFPESPSEAANYASDATRGNLPSSPSPVDNVYPVVNLPGIEPTVLTLTDEAGYPTGPTVTSPDQPKFSELSSGRSNDATVLNILRGRERPVTDPDPAASKVQDGNVLLASAVLLRGGVTNPPEPGGVNVRGFAPDSPVKFYTEALIDKNASGPDEPFLPPEAAGDLRRGRVIDTPRDDMVPRDIPLKRRATLSDYLGRITRVGLDGPSGGVMRGNVYPVDAEVAPGARGADAARPVTTLSDESGFARGPTASRNADKFLVDAAVTSGRSDAARNISGYAPSRTAPGDAPVNGHELLRDATGPITGPVNPSAYGGRFPDIATKQIDPKLGGSAGVLKTFYGDTKDVSKSVIYNRFNPDLSYEAYVRGGDADEAQTVLDRTLFAKKYKMGASLPAEGTARDVSFGRLAQVGNALMSRATYEINSMTPGNDPTSGTSQAVDILPGGAQIGVMRPKQFQLTAEDVIRELTTDGIDESLLVDPMSLSWGSLNSPQDQFTGITAFGMQLLAAAMVTALGVVIAVFMALFSVPTGSGDGTTWSAIPDGTRRPYGLNRSDMSAAFATSPTDAASLVFLLAGGNFNLWRLFGIQPTQSNLQACVAAGAFVFFGVGAYTTDLGGIATAFASDLLAAAQNPGFHVVMARTFTRSARLIADAFMNLGKSFATGALAGAKAIIDILDTLKSSKFMRGLNVFAQLGDQVITADIRDEAQGYGRSTIDEAAAGGFTRRFNSRIDNTLNGRAVGRSRLRGADGKVTLNLAWSSYRAPDMLILPATMNAILTAGGEGALELQTPPMKHMPDAPSNTGVLDSGGLKNGGSYISPTGGRISTENREVMEDALEAEYVPFYLHDVRTNEILSFHAFLASLSDDYAASYASFDAFGRVEPVKTYKGTQRKIGFSFYLASTSEADFNSMWLKINKLTTMVYPQFTEGRTITDASKSYVMEAPFSQTIGSPPLVRLRIGDLIRSNYSKFNLARLFGYGTPGTKFNNVEMTAPDSFTKSRTQEEISDAQRLARDLFFTTGETYRLAAGVTPAARASDESTNSGAYTAFESLGPSLSGIELKIIEVFDPPANFDCIAEIVEGVEIDVISGGSQAGKIGVGLRYYFKRNQLTPSPATQKKIDESAADTTAKADYYEAVNEFMNDTVAEKGNAISRAFRSSGGKGLAGFIDSLAFDWYDKVTWETEGAGRRAPKMCKITISFSPIHDITPGLDVNGFNRAPIYPVGPSAFSDMRGAETQRQGAKQ